MSEQMSQNIAALLLENSDYKARVKALNDKIGVLKNEKAALSAELEHLKASIVNYHEITALGAKK